MRREGCAPARPVVNIPLFGEIDGAGFADDGDANLSGVAHFLLDTFRHVMRQNGCAVFADLFWLHDDAQFTARLDGIAVFDAFEGFAYRLKLFQTFEIHFSRL